MKPIKAKKFIKELSGIYCEIALFLNKAPLRPGLNKECFECIMQTATYHECIIHILKDAEIERNQLPGTKKIK